MFFINWIDDIKTLFLSDEESDYKICLAPDKNYSENYFISCHYDRNDWQMGYPPPKAFIEFCELLKGLNISFTLKTEYLAYASKSDLKPFTTHFNLNL